MGRSIVEICNLALSKVGDDVIIALDDETKVGKLCNRFFDQAYEEMLAMHPWNDAIKRIELTADSTAPVYGFTYRYFLPEECARVLEVDGGDQWEWKREGRYIHTDLQELKIKYLAKPARTQDLSPLMTKALYLNLAIHMAYNLQETRTLLDALLNELKEVLREARSADAQEGTPDIDETSSWLDARWNPTYYTSGRYRGISVV